MKGSIREMVSERQSLKAMIAHTPDPYTLEAEARGAGVEGQPWLYIKFKASVSFMEPCI